MKIYRDPAGIQPPANSAAIGNFDGVHPGHGAVINAARDAANRLGNELAVVTFDPHTRSWFNPDQPPFLISPDTEKIRLLANFGVAHLIILPFDANMAGMMAEDFACSILSQRLSVRHVAIGRGFRFGRKRGGDTALLESVMAGEVSEVESRQDGAGELIASRRIRDCIMRGDYRAAAGLLGRWWCFGGEVVAGDQIGRTIGFPTANIRLHPLLLRPPLGVSAVRVRIEDEDDWRDGVASYGWRPAVGGQDLRFEVYLLDYSGHLYGRHLCIWPVCHLRPEHKFADLDELRAAIGQDCIAAQQALHEAGVPNKPEAG